MKRENKIKSTINDLDSRLRIYSLFCRLWIYGYSPPEDICNSSSCTLLVWWFIKQHHLWNCQLAHNIFHWWLYESGLLCHSTWFFLLFGPWIQLARLTQSADWLGKWVDKLPSIFAGKSRSFLHRSQYTIGISILFGHPSAIIGLCSFHTCIWDLHV